MHLLLAATSQAEIDAVVRPLGRLRALRVEGLVGAEAVRTRAHGLDGYDAALLALGEAGAALAQELREAGAHLPLLLLADDRRGLERAYAAGIDDFLVRPAAPGELLCRLDAVVRRRFGFAQPFVACGDLTVPLDGEPPRFRGRPVHLEPRLSRTLVCLARQAGRVVARDTLHAALYPDQPEIGIEVIKVHVCRLRRRLAEAGVDRGVIETVADVGYRLQAGRLTPGARTLAVRPGARAA